MSICRLDPTSRIPDWIVDSAFFSVTRTDAELSIVCDTATVPNGVVAETGWVAFRFPGPFDFSLTGIQHSISEPMAPLRDPVTTGPA